MVKCGLAAQSGASRSGGGVQQLEPLHVVPPERVQILVRVFVEGLLEVEHDQRPAGEDQLLAAALLAGWRRFSSSTRFSSAPA